MSEHNNPEQKYSKEVRELMEMNEIDKEFAKSISEQFKTSEWEAIARVNSIKRFSLVCNGKLKKESFLTAIDLIAAGLVVPTFGSSLDYPLINFIMQFEAEATESEAKGNKNCRLDINTECNGKKYCVSILRKKDADAIKAKGE